jgi:hypothetical protein
VGPDKEQDQSQESQDASMEDLISGKKKKKKKTRVAKIKTLV